MNDNRVPFVIESKPAYIVFTCPSCGEEITIPWKDIKAPDYWGDDWGEIKCPICGKEVTLGEYEYD